MIEKKQCNLCKNMFLPIHLFKWGALYPPRNIALKGMDFCNGCYHTLVSDRNKYKLDDQGRVVQDNKTF